LAQDSFSNSVTLHNLRQLTVFWKWELLPEDQLCYKNRLPKMPGLVSSGGTESEPSHSFWANCTE